MTIKKQYEEIYSILETNKSKKVSTILPELLEIMTRKNNSSGQTNTFHKVDDKVVAIYCYYHKTWELVSECEYGSKKNSSTGLNTMCKEGVSNWTKQQRIKKQQEGAIVGLISSGEIKVEDIGSKQKEIFENSKVIVPREDNLGYNTLEECLEVYYNNKNEEL